LKRGFGGQEEEEEEESRKQNKEAKYKNASTTRTTGGFRENSLSLSLSLSLGNPTLRKNSTARRIRKKASGHPETSNKTHMQRMQHPFGKYNKQWLVLAIPARSWTSR
jgi:hypothetical protein